MVTVWDAVVLGTGSGGKLAATGLAEQRLRVLALDPGLFGGECPYLACVPSKAMLLAAHAGLGWAEAVRRRDEVTDGRDDAASRKSLQDAEVVTVRARGRLLPDADGRHRVQLSGLAFEHDDAAAERNAVDVAGGLDVEDVVVARLVVVAVGSEASVPPVPGLDAVPFWTSDDALSTGRQPQSLVILGGGAVGCELAQAFALFGTRVHLVEIADRLLGTEADWVGPLLAEQLRDDGVEVRTGVKPVRVDATGSGVRVGLDDGGTLEAERLLVAGGRSGRAAGLGLEALGVEPDEHGQLGVDARCRVLDGSGRVVEGLFAVGDVTPDSAYTHSANHQARVVAAEVAGRGYDADYSANPRALYTEPAVFCLGLTPDQADDQGLNTRRLALDLDQVERGTLVEHATSADGSRAVRGRVELLLDTDADVLVGASCVGPAADAWGGELALAIRARVPLSTLQHHIRAFPTWSEAITAVLPEE